MKSDIHHHQRYVGSPIRRLDDELMDLMIARNLGSRYARRDGNEVPRVIEGVLEEVRNALLREKEVNQRIRTRIRNFEQRSKSA